MNQLTPDLLNGPILDVAEACADALLSAVGLLLVLVHESPVTGPAARVLAIAVIDTVLERTEREGAR